MSRDSSNDRKKSNFQPGEGDLKENIWQIIFRHDTPGSRLFDIILLVLIGISVLVIMLDSVESYHERFKKLFYVLEWAFTILFTIEYLVRVWVVRRRHRYVFSFFGIVDLLSILPTYLALLFCRNTIPGRDPDPAIAADVSCIKNGPPRRRSQHSSERPGRKP